MGIKNKWCGYDEFCDETTQKMGDYPGELHDSGVPTVEQPDTVIDFDMPVPRMKNLCKCDSPKIERRRFSTFEYDFCIKCKREV